VLLMDDVIGVRTVVLRVSDDAQRSTSVRPYCLLRDKSQPGKN
jgi:hypothetical protein